MKTKTSELRVVRADTLKSRKTKYRPRGETVVFAKAMRGLNVGEAVKVPINAGMFAGVRIGMSVALGREYRQRRAEDGVYVVRTR